MTDTIEFADALAAANFQGLINFKKEDKFQCLLRKNRYCRCEGWSVYKKTGDRLCEKEITKVDAMDILEALRKYDYEQVFYDLMAAEHSWGMETPNVNSIAKLIETVQEKYKDDEMLGSSWGALNVFLLFIKDAEYVRIQNAEIPCICFKCIKNSILQWPFKLLHTLLLRRLLWKKMNSPEE